MAISEEYVVRSLIEIKEKLAKVESTLDSGHKLVVEQLDINNKHLADHMHRTELLEVEIKGFQEFMTQTKFLTKLIIIVSGSIMAICGLAISLFELFLRR